MLRQRFWMLGISIPRGSHDNTLEVYEGFNKTPLTSKDRFFYMQNDEMEYYPVKLVVALELDNLPKGEEFVEKINEKSRYGVEFNSNC